MITKTTTAAQNKFSEVATSVQTDFSFRNITCSDYAVAINYENQQAIQTAVYFFLFLPGSLFFSPFVCLSFSFSLSLHFRAYCD